MLHDPRREPFTKERLVSWLRDQPPRKTYNWCSMTNCLTAQYLRHCGYDPELVNPGIWKRAMGGYGSYFNIAAGLPRTFGAARRRAIREEFADV